MSESLANHRCESDADQAEVRARRYSEALKRAPGALEAVQDDPASRRALERLDAAAAPKPPERRPLVSPPPTALDAPPKRSKPRELEPLDVDLPDGSWAETSEVGPKLSAQASPERRREAAAPKKPAAQPAALTRNPRKLRYHRNRIQAARSALHKANRHARRDELDRLNVPRDVHDVTHDICDDVGALSGAIDWVRRTHGPGVAIEVEAAGLFRERGGVQRDDWSCARARRKVALLTLLLMAPHLLKRSEVTGSTSDEPLIVTAGVPQTLLVLLLRSAQREPYHVRTLQRDLAEIDLCTDLLLRWKTPIAHAQSWEKRGSEHGVVNRYCIRAGMVREQWRRARDAGEALVKQTMLMAASWMVWQPAPVRGSPVMIDRGGVVLTAPS